MDLKYTTSKQIIAALKRQLILEKVMIVFWTIFYIVDVAWSILLFFNNDKKNEIMKKLVIDL